MLALQLPETKDVMNHLLLNTTFDNFVLLEASISTYMTTIIDGHLMKDFYSQEELEEKELTNEHCISWEQAKPFCLQLIKGKRTPLQFKITFSLSQKNIEHTLQSLNSPFSIEQVKGLLVHFRFDGKQLLCTTGINLTTFTMDKSLEHEWDALFQKFLKQHEIMFTVQE